MPQDWIPWANRTAQNFSQTYPGAAQKPRMLLLHSTEGAGWPGYSGGANAPHATVMIDRANRTVHWRQHFPASRSARALANQPGGVETNRAGVFQVEIIGTSGWASTANPRATYRLGSDWQVPSYPDWFWAELGRLLAWLHAEWGIALTAISDVFPAWNAGNNRMSASQWSSFSGVCGHAHAPENDHSDPGAIPAYRIVAHAKAIVASGRPAGYSGEDLDMTVEEFLKAPLGGSGLTIGSALERAGWAADTIKREIPQAMVDKWLGASGPTVGVALQSAHHQLAALQGRLDGLLKALEPLAAGQGVDLAAVEAAAKRGAQSALENAAVEVKLGGENAG